MENLFPYSTALAAGASYGLSAVFSKRALELGAGTFRSLTWSNWAIAVCFIPYPFLSEENFSHTVLLHGSLLGLLFFFGQLSCFLALRRGDASVVTTVMGSKSLFVAFFVVLVGFKSDLDNNVWIAAILACMAVALLGWPSKRYSIPLRSLSLATIAAACFGLTDALVPYFAQSSDPFNLLFIMVSTVALLSIPIIPMCEGKFIEWRGKADKCLLWGSILVAGQALLMSIAIGFHDVPTEANILYSTRGLWSLFFATTIGGWLGISESTAPKKVIFRRSLGAMLLLAGIWLIA